MKTLAKLLLLTLFAGFCFTACDPLPCTGIQLAPGDIEPFQGNECKPAVAVIGDSISSTYTWPTGPLAGQVAGNHDNVHATLGTDYWVSVDGISGSTLQTQTPNIDRYAALNPQPNIVVFELGTNDVNDWLDDSANHVQPPARRTLATWQTAMQATLNKFPNACIVAVNVNAHRGAGTPNLVYNASAIGLNSWLAAHVTRIVDWDTAVWNNRQANTPITVDGLHPNATGKQLLADMEKAQILTC